MKVSKNLVARIVKEELARIIVQRLAEAEVSDANEDKKDKEKKGKENFAPHEQIPNMVPPKGSKKDDLPPVDPNVVHNSNKPDVTPPEDVPEKDIEKDPVDDELSKDEAKPDDESDPLEAEKSSITDDITGKSVQSIVMNQKSELLPGAKEISITFDQVPDPFKILILQTGEIKFFYKGIHNTL